MFIKERLKSEVRSVQISTILMSFCSRVGIRDLMTIFDCVIGQELNFIQFIR